MGKVGKRKQIFGQLGNCDMHVYHVKAVQSGWRLEGGEGRSSLHPGSSQLPAPTQADDSMWAQAVHLVFIGSYLQVSTCYQSCTLFNFQVNCIAQHHYWIPALPPSITHLFLELNYISEINSTSLRIYEQLQQLDIGSQHVPLVIRNNAFLRQRSLTRLVLGGNSGLKLEPEAFEGLVNLQHLSLDGCNLNDSILADSFLQPLLSLETLVLSYNNIARVRPGLFFSTFPKFTELNLKSNPIERLCEEDLAGFQGRYFRLLNLGFSHLHESNGSISYWERCGNPFRRMAFNVLDLSGNGLSLNNSQQFFKAIQGTQITELIISHHILGKGFSHNNNPDPDESTFEGLNAVQVLDLSKGWIFALKKAVFNPLKHAVIIDVSKNKINKIERNAFDGLQGHLRMLNLSSNLLGEITSDTFTNLTNLWVLDLSNNYIGVLGYKAFSGLPLLRDLYLTGNSLRELGFPASLPSLNYLNLGDNKLSSIYSITELAMNSIHVDVTDNRLTNLGDVYTLLSTFRRLEKFFYGGNSILWCSPQVSVPHNTHLKVLDLHGISLQTVWMVGDCLNLFDHLENLRSLDLSFNSLMTLPQGIFRGLSSIVTMDLSFNALTYLQTDVFPVSLKKLYLTSNFLVSPDPATFQSLSFLSLAGNRFYCDCSLESFLKWLNVTNIAFLELSPLEEYRCEFPAHLHNLPLLNYSMIIEPCEIDDEKAVQHLKLYLFIFSAVFITTIILSGIVHARLRGQIFIIYKKTVGRVLEGPKPIPPSDEVQHDAFFCFSNGDYRWVEAALLKRLDNQFSEKNILHCCFEERDFLPGEDHLSNITDAIWGSRKTVCIVSKRFLKDGWCLEAFTLAQGRMLEELTDVLIMLVVGKVAHYQLMKYNAVRTFIRRRQYLVWPEDPQDLEWFYDRLMSRILKDKKVKKFAEDKPEPSQPDSQNKENIELEDIRAIAT